MRLFSRKKGGTDTTPANTGIANDNNAIEVPLKGQEISTTTTEPLSQDPEKLSPSSSGQNSSHERLPFGDDDPVLRDIPWHVRRVVSLTDDPTEPTVTFRYFVLTLVFVLPGAFLSQMSSYRTTSAPYSVFFVQIISNYAGVWLAKILPSKIIKVPFTRQSFSLNPGPWSTKEHVLVTISAASGATYNLAYAPISIAQLYFDDIIHPAIAITFMWSVVFIGYSFAAIGRQFLLYDPQYPW
jgi:OPT oligopeptide transporter protein